MATIVPPCSWASTPGLANANSPEGCWMPRADSSWPQNPSHVKQTSKRPGHWFSKSLSLEAAGVGCPRALSSSQPGKPSCCRFSSFPLSLTKPSPCKHAHRRMGGKADLWLPVLLSQFSVCHVQAETTALSQEAAQPHAALSKAFQARRAWSHAPETTSGSPCRCLQGENCSASLRNPAPSDLPPCRARG